MMMVMDVSAARFRVAENERLDHHWHRARVRQLFPDVDKIEIFEVDAIDRNDPGARQQLSLQNIADELGDIRVEDQDQRLSVFYVAFHSLGNSLREIANQWIGRPE